MPADIALPISVSTNAPDVDLGAGRSSVVNQSVGDERQAFNQEYQRQVDARNEQRSRQKNQESRQQDARQADIRADERASQRADRQADDARRTEQNRRDERISQADRRNQQQESGKRLPDNGNDRVRQADRENNRAEDLASQKNSRQDSFQQDSARQDRSQQNSAQREGANAEIRQTQQAQSKQTESQLAQAKQSGTQSKDQMLQQEQADNAQQGSKGEITPAVDEVVLSPYILQQLSDADVTSANEVTGIVDSESESTIPMSTLAQWMEQTLGADGGVDDGADISADIRVDQAAANSDYLEVMESSVASASVDTNTGKEPTPISESKITSVLESEISSTSPEDMQGVALSKANDPAMLSDAIIKPEGQAETVKVAELNAAKAESAGALRSMDDVARLLDAKRSAENPLEKALPGSKILPLSQAIESVNRSDRLAEPTFLKQADLSSDELKQMMQERKVLLEGGRLEGGRLEGAAMSKAGAEDVMTPQADKLLALDKRLSQGMEGLRQLRIPGQDVKKASVDEGVKPSSFGRALEQMSSIKTEEAKPLSTSIATPLNKPGFIPEFNQRIMMMIGQKIQEAEIKLNPAELGSIDVSIKFNQDQQASIVFASQHSVTRDALEQGAQRLRDMLEQNGVDVDNVDIQENLTHDRHDKGNEDERGLAANAKGQDSDDDTVGGDGLVATIETDSLVDFYA